MYRKAADGTGDEEMLPVTGQNPTPTSWSRDGRYLLYDVQGESSHNSDTWVLPLQGDSKPFPFLSTSADESGGTFSPDGRWVAYISNETGSDEIYVRPFPPSNRGKWLVSKGAPSFPRWRQDGKELGYVAPDGSVMSVQVTANPGFQLGEPKVLFKRPPNALVLDTAPDFNLFLVNVPIDAAGSTPEPFTVVLNWTSLLKK